MSDANFTRSMSRKAGSPDNAACESFFGRLKNELFYSRDWKSTTIEQFIKAVDSYIRWYNQKRIEIFLGSLSPIEYRVSLGLAAENHPSFYPHPQMSRRVLWLCFRRRRSDRPTFGKLLACQVQVNRRISWPLRRSCNGTGLELAD